MFDLFFSIIGSFANTNSIFNKGVLLKNKISQIQYSQNLQNIFIKNNIYLIKLIHFTFFIYLIYGRGVQTEKL